MGREVRGRINRNPLSTCWSLARAQIVAKASAQRTHTHHRVCEHFASNFYHRLAHVHRPSIVHPHPDSRPHASTNTYTHTHPATSLHRRLAIEDTHYMYTFTYQYTSLPPRWLRHHYCHHQRDVPPGHPAIRVRNGIIVFICHVGTGWTGWVSGYAQCVLA